MNSDRLGLLVHLNQGGKTETDMDIFKRLVDFDLDLDFDLDQKRNLLTIWS